MRYAPHTPADVRAMLETVGKGSVDELFAQVPAEMRTARFDLPPALDEASLLAEARERGARNVDPETTPSFLGGAMTGHHVPPVVDHLASRGEFLTAYTPYQAEASQGTLQAIFEFQTMVCELLGLDVANASLYDGATALAEAVLMVAGGREGRVVVSAGLDPLTRDVLTTYLAHQPLEVDVVPLEGGLTDPGAIRDRIGEDVHAVACQVPNVLGRIEDGPGIAQAAGDVPVIAAVDPISTAVLSPPGEWGAAVATAEGQPLGNPPSWGGPAVGLMAAREEWLRDMPGRIVGETTDEEGRRGYVLTLQTREQHIRREKATSNICTNQGLMALRTTIHLACLGPAGLRRVADLCAAKAGYLRDRILELDGWSEPAPAPFFREVAVHPPVAPAEVNRRLLDRGILGGRDLGALDPAFEGTLVLATTERTDRDDIDRLVAELEEIG